MNLKNHGRSKSAGQVHCRLKEIQSSYQAAYDTGCWAVNNVAHLITVKQLLDQMLCCSGTGEQRLIDLEKAQHLKKVWRQMQSLDYMKKKYLPSVSLLNHYFGFAKLNACVQICSLGFEIKHALHLWIKKQFLRGRTFNSTDTLDPLAQEWAEVMRSLLFGELFWELFVIKRSFGVLMWWLKGNKSNPVFAAHLTESVDNALPLQSFAKKKKA